MCEQPVSIHSDDDSNSSQSHEPCRKSQFSKGPVKIYEFEPSNVTTEDKYPLSYIVDEK